jgi:uncharacterized membrane protein YeaQ/YmgE (transglycosylase-associated protein family)
MNFTIVISWVAIGFFTGWIATHIRKEQTFNHGLSNLAVGVLGALLGGLAAFAILGARKGYNAFTLYSIGAFVVSSAMIHLTRAANRHHRNDYVS